MDPERIAEWTAVFGSPTVCVKTPIPQLADLPAKPRSKVYFLDLGELTDEQYNRLIDHIAAKFSLDPFETAADVQKRGVPILADDCMVTVENPQKWL